ncbi:TonB-dependent receptor [Reichenbachiella sp. MALMAid0571]|uniref:SusC/RagA family TonB-linked outer membrane protein n=1 Tax=Reichenbachiella sp. MALMAid0571 TaxID=3143939 RepID=UPI0032DEEDFD
MKFKLLPINKIIVYSLNTVIVLLTFSGILLATGEINAQKNTSVKQIQIDINFQNDNLITVFEKITQETGLEFIYNKREFRNQVKFNRKYKNQSLYDVLMDISEMADVQFRQINSNINVKTRLNRYSNKGAVFVQEDIDVSGKITDENGENLPGASVIIKGTTNGTTSDVEGNYKLSAPDDAVLVVSFVGYKNVEVQLGNQNVIDIQMEIDAERLEEVLVVGYGTQKRVNVTGAVATVNSKELTQVPVAATSQALAGRLPGLISKQSEGKPGSAPSISIRGFGSPLIIVDGIQQDNYYNIDPNEIESFSVLKDAAAAVYGSRAGNGVILITTKRGKNGPPTINFSASTSVQTPTVYPEFVDSWEYAIIQNEANEFAGQAPAYTDEEIQKYKDGTDPDYPNVDHYSEVIKKWSALKMYNLNMSGGSDNVDYFLSAGYMFQDGIYNSDGVNMKRYNVRSNVDVRLAKNLSVGLDLSARTTNNHDVPFNSQAIFQTIGTTTNKYPASYPDPTKIPYVGRSSHNPQIKINPDLSGYDNTNRQYLTGALTLKYNIPFVKGLSVKARGNYVGDRSYEKTWTIPYSTYYYDRVNDDYAVASTGGNYSLSEENSREEMLTFQGFIDYEKTFSDHEIKGLLVSEIIDTRSNWFNGYKDGFISGAVDQMFAGSSENMSTNGSAFEESRMSYVGRLNYVYKSRYLLEGTLRYDASSRFASDYRWALFPSLSLGWRLSEEQFIRDNFSFIDNMKLRLSYSHTGYDLNAGAYQYLSTYSYSTQYVFGNTPYKTIKNNGIENPFISWEDIYTYNSGLEVDLWNGLLGVEFDWFYRLRKGILGSRTSTLPNTFGASLPQENINSIDNRGIELVLKHRNRINDFNYSIDGNISWTRSKYVDYAEQEYDDPDEERLYKRTGQWTNRTFGYKTDGFFQTQAEIDESPIDYDQKGNSTLQPGMIKYVDVNDDKVINWRDRVEIGRNGTPEIMFGLNLSCEYKGFDLSMLWQGASNFNLEFSQNMRTLTINNVWNSYKFLYDGRWTPENPNADFPRTTNGHNSYMNTTSDLWLKSASYLRLKSFSVGYSLPQKLINKISLNKVRIYLAGYNTLTISKLGKFPFDPEGIGHSWTYPLYKSYSVGLNIVL